VLLHECSFDVFRRGITEDQPERNTDNHKISILPRWRTHGTPPITARALIFLDNTDELLDRLIISIRD
jgi:hypothetical protein